VSFGCLAVVEERELVHCRDASKHGVHDFDLASIDQAELHHAERALARATPSDT
jgi:hypothetical protein